LNNELKNNDILVNITDSLDSVIEHAKKINTAKIYEEYEVNNLQELLSLEIMDMIQSGVKIKVCENCGKYFIQNHKNKKYCDRIDENGMPCPKVAKKKHKQDKLESNPAFKLYATAYKTHYARYKSQNIDKIQFTSWQYEAKEQLKRVESGELDISIFEK